MIRPVRALIAVALSMACITVLPGTASATVYAQIEGTGSTWSELIVQQWIADVNATGMKVVYTGGGSTKGTPSSMSRSVWATHATMSDARPSDSAAVLCASAIRISIVP